MPNEFEGKSDFLSMINFDALTKIGDKVTELRNSGQMARDPNEKAALEKQGIASPHVAYNSKTGQAYDYYSLDQFKKIQSGELHATISPNTYQIGRIDQQVTGGGSGATASGSVGQQGAVGGGALSQGDSAIVMPPLYQLPVGSPVPTGVPVNQPHPFAGTNVEEMMGVGIAAMFILMSFRLVGGLIGRR